MVNNIGAYLLNMDVKYFWRRILWFLLDVCFLFPLKTELLYCQQMSKQYTVKNAILGKDAFGVTVYPNVDYAFIIALVVILDEIENNKD